MAISETKLLCSTVCLVLYYLAIQLLAAKVFLLKELSVIYIDFSIRDELFYKSDKNKFNAERRCLAKTWRRIFVWRWSPEGDVRQIRLSLDVGYSTDIRKYL